MKKPGKQLSIQAFIDEANRLAGEGDIRARGWQDSAFRGQDGLPLGYVRNMYWCDGIGWSVNTSPYLPGTNTDFYVRHGDGKFESRYRKDWTPENPRGIDGEFIDSSEPFQAHQMDFCRERFVYMKTPLSWCSTNAVPGIYKGMIAFRKAHKSFRVPDGAVKYYTQMDKLDEGVIAYELKGVEGEVSDSIFAVYNASSEATTVTLPEGEWTICVQGDKAGTESLGTATGSITVDGVSTTILVKGALK
jgi:hypothetical protein